MSHTMYISIPQQSTHQATAEAIHQHLIAHPNQQPSDDADRHTHLIVRLDGTQTALTFSELTNGTISAFPCEATDEQEAKDRTPFTGDYIGNGVILHQEGLQQAPPEDSTEHRETTRRIRLVVMRTVRYRNKVAARNAA